MVMAIYKEKIKAEHIRIGKKCCLCIWIPTYL